MVNTKIIIKICTMKESSNMRVLVTGAKGQLGFDVIKSLKYNNITHLGIDKDELDITVESDVTKFVKEYQPTIIIHCAAYTAVDKAEEDKELCHKINVLGTEYLAKAAKEVNSKFVYISTDYVFDGNGARFFTINDQPNPVNHYGETKYQGELVVRSLLNEFYIIRISWVFGINGNNFVKTMLKLSEIREEINVVSDQIGSPTYTYDLSKAIVELIQTEKYGVHHITNDGVCSWNDFAKEIFRQANKQTIVHPILSKDYPTKAKRPLNSRLQKNYIQLRSWQEALAHFLKEYNDD